MKKKVLLLLIVMAFGPLLSAKESADGKKAEEAIKVPKILCPQKPDPPPVVDGELSEWQNLPGAIEITSAHVRWGKAKISGEADLGGTLRMCWDKNYLYLAADIIDDKITVTQTGKQIWKTDHIEFDVDTAWEAGAKGLFGKEQFAFGFSPGNFSATDDPLADLEPEFYIFYPDLTDNAEIDVASKKTEDGYTLEVRIPWSFLKVKPQIGTLIAVDIRLSDSDDSNCQESMTSLYPAAWKGRKREKMIPVFLGDTSGKVRKLN